MIHKFTLPIAFAISALATCTALAAGTYDQGASDTEILIGITAPLSGPASAYGIACAAHEAYFKMVNEKGGINGRKLKLLCEDDSFSPPKAIELTRKLVESDGVLFIYNSLGTSVNTAIQPYLAGKKIPHVLINSGASKWSDPAKNHWTTAAIPNYTAEAAGFAAHIMSNSPDAKVGLIYQGDDYGKSYLTGLIDGFGDQLDKYLIAKESYEISDPTVDAQILNLKAAGVDTVVIGALSKHAAQAIRKIGELNWMPKMYLTWSSTSIKRVLEPAGLDAAKGIISTTVIKLPDDPQWGDDQEVKDYLAFSAKYYPDGATANPSNLFAYAANDVLMDILRRAGDKLTRENIRQLAQNINMHPDMFMPGIEFKTTPENLNPISKFQMIQFDGAEWNTVGEPVGR